MHPHRHVPTIPHRHRRRRHIKSPTTQMLIIPFRRRRLRNSCRIWRCCCKNRRLICSLTRCFLRIALFLLDTGEKGWEVCFWDGAVGPALVAFGFSFAAGVGFVATEGAQREGFVTIKG